MAGGTISLVPGLLLAVVLQRAGAGAHSPAELASAFDTTYWWALGIAALSLIPCIVLLRAEKPQQAKLAHESAGVDAAAAEPMGA